MNSGLYEIIALGARYVFALLMLLIVIRAWRITIIDSRRAAKLRRWSPETGIVGEMQVLEGDGKVRRGMLFPVIREGMIGRSRKADIRLRSNAVRARHAYFEMTRNGLLMRAAGSARMEGSAGRVRSMMLTDGSVITIGRLRLMLILADATAAPSVAPVRAAEMQPEEEEADIFEVENTFTTSSGGVMRGENDVFTHVMDDRAADAALYEEQNPFAKQSAVQKQHKEEEWWPDA